VSIFHFPPRQASPASLVQRVEARSLVALSLVVPARIAFLDVPSHDLPLLVFVDVLALVLLPAYDGSLLVLVLSVFLQ
jgi:hypothetical protein